MKTVFDPLQRLTTVESIRFVGTIGGLAARATMHWSALLELYLGRETRSGTELAKFLEAAAGCSPKVANVTVEEAAAVGLINPLPAPTQKHKKFLLGDPGRVVNALRSQTGWLVPRNHAMLFLRPAFEANGDYLIQAMRAIALLLEPADAVESFRQSVREMALRKVETLPEGLGGAKWDAYKQAVVARKRSIFGESTDTDDGNITLEALQRRKKRESDQLLASLKAKKFGASPGSSSPPRTFEHHFVRSRAWLEALGMVWRGEQGDVWALTSAGVSLLDYFNRALLGENSIPPSSSTLSDCFRIEDEKIREIWGTVIDDTFWEEAVLSTTEVGCYTPSESELLARFDFAFESVRVSGIAEAMLNPMRQVLFFSFLWEGRPVRDLDQVFYGPNSLPVRCASAYGLGRNRQGRLAYLFRKS